MTRVRRAFYVLDFVVGACVLFGCLSFVAAAEIVDFESGDPGLEAGNAPAGSSFGRVQIDTNGDGTDDNWVLQTTAPGGWAGYVAKLPLSGTALIDELRNALEFGGSISYDLYYDPATVNVVGGTAPAWFESVMIVQTGWSDTVNGLFPNIWDQEVSSPGFTVPNPGGPVEKASFEFVITDGDTVNGANSGYQNTQQFELLESSDPSYPVTGPPNGVPFEWANFGFGNNNESAAVTNATLYFDNIVISANESNVGPSVCDFDSDGDCDPVDLDDLYANWGGGAPYDVDTSGTADAMDISAWLTAASDQSNPFNVAGKTFALGDLDFDGDIDSGDLGVLLNNFGDTSSLLYEAGNLNDDIAVDSADLGIQLNGFGFTSLAAAAVPEPDSGLQVIVSLLGWIVLLRRR